MIMKQSSKYYVLTHLLAFASLHSAKTHELEAIYLPQLPVINSSPHPDVSGNFIYPALATFIIIYISGSLPSRASRATHAVQNVQTSQLGHSLAILTIMIMRDNTGNILD